MFRHEESGFLEIRPLLGINGDIYTKDALGNIYALTPDGNIKWQNQMGQKGGESYMVASPDGSVIYTPGRDSTLIALDAVNGVILWSVKTHLYYHAGPTVDSQGNVYYYGIDDQNNRCVYSVDPSGKLRWKFKVKYAWNPPGAGINIDYNGNIYFDFDYTGITSLDYAGHLRWKLDYHDQNTDSPIICDSENNLYILPVLGGSKIWCYLPDGTIKFSVEIPGCTSTQFFPGAINSSGIMYFGGNSEWIAAIK